MKMYFKREVQSVKKKLNMHPRTTKYSIMDEIKNSLNEFNSIRQDK